MAKQQENKLSKVLFFVALTFFSIPSYASASNVDEFARLSQKKNGLVEGDCQRYGGTQKVSELGKKTFVELFEKGEKLGGYNNVIGLDGYIYIVFSVSSGGWFEKNVLGVRTSSICRF